MDDDVRSGKVERKPTVFVLLDFSNAFNTVDVLLGIFFSLSIFSSAIDCFRSYLYDRQQRASIDNVYSSWRTTSVGVLQGGT